MLRECLEKIRTAKRRAAPNTWTSRFAGIRNLQHRVAVLSDAEVGPRTAILVSLANVTNLLRPILGGKVLKSRRKRIKEIAKGEMVAAATREAVAAVQAAMFAAQTAATVAVIATTTTR